MNEIWKTIKGFEDYEISSLGRVKSLKFGKEKIMIKSVNRQGYLHVRLCNKNKCETKKIIFIRKTKMAMKIRLINN